MASWIRSWANNSCLSSSFSDCARLRDASRWRFTSDALKSADALAAIKEVDLRAIDSRAEAQRMVRRRFSAVADHPLRFSARINGSKVDLLDRRERVGNRFGSFAVIFVDK